MLWDLLQVVMLAMTFMYVFLKAPTARTRRMALLPAGAAVMEVLHSGLTDTWALWPLTLLLTAARLALIFSCIGAVKHERRLHRKRQRRTQNNVVPLQSSTTLSSARRPCA